MPPWNPRLIDRHQLPQASAAIGGTPFMWGFRPGYYKASGTVWLDRARTLGYEEQITNAEPRRGNVGIDLSGGHAAMDYDEHARTYLRFILFIKVSVVFMVILLGGMAYFLV